MKWLALDTSSAALSLALGQGELGNIVPLTSFHQRLNRQHGASLVPEIHHLLHDQNWSVDEIDGLIVGVGPGSYTGLRIGVSLAKIWGISRQIPVYQVSSLALLAQQALAGANDLILPVVDARRLSAYTNLFRKQGGQVKALGQDQHVDWQDFLDGLPAMVEPLNFDQIVLLGNQIDEFVQVIQHRYPSLPLQVQTDNQLYPRADLSFTGLTLDRVQDIHTLNPNYVHATLAERQWADQHHRPVANEEENEGYIEHFSK